MVDGAREAKIGTQKDRRIGTSWYRFQPVFFPDFNARDALAASTHPMPTRDLVQRFIGMVEAGRFVEAMQSFYAVNASMQENDAAPRRGLAALIEHERKVLAAHTSVRAAAVDFCLGDGDQVVIRWLFEFTRPDGRLVSLDELAWQRWQDGRIVEERFFYDPAPLKMPSGPSPAAPGPRSFADSSTA